MANEANTFSLVTNLNTDPYYDDFDETKNFHKILFRPGVAVQARELTQMQTILQNQIDRFGEHVFREGSPVRGCEINVDTHYNYVKLRNLQSDGSTAANVYHFTIDGIVKGQTSGVLAQVLKVNDGAEANTPNYKTLFVKYVASNTNGYTEFANNEILQLVANTDVTANTITASSTGFGYAITVGSGIIFAKDHFIRVAEQTIVLDKYTNKPTYSVGFNTTESIVTSVDDSSLQDPANGAYNYAAPGANRLKLNPVLTKVAAGTTNSNNFTLLVQLKDGLLQVKADVPQYSKIRDELAKRTYEESGDYIVRGLQPRVREHLKVANNQGVYTAGEGGDANNLVIAVQPGKAYVQGYDNELRITENITIQKGIDYEDVNDAKTYADYGNYVVVDNVVGAWDLDNQAIVSIRDAEHKAASNGQFSTTGPVGAQIGTARVRDIQYVSGTPGSAEAQYRLYLGDIKITTDTKSFKNARSIHYDGSGSSQANGKADILNSTGLSANTQDSAFESAVFRLPARAIRRVKDSGGTVDTDWIINKEHDASFNTSGVATFNNSADTTETFIGSGTLSDVVARENFYVVFNQNANTANLTGTISLSGNTVTGTATSFTTELNVGDVISTTGVDAYVISSITNTTSAKVHGSGHSASGDFHRRFLKGQVVDMGGVGKNGDRSISVSSGTSVTVTLNDNLGATASMTAIARMSKADVAAATKSTIRNRHVRIVTNAAASGTQYAGNTSGPWPLGISDGFYLREVRKSSAFASNTAGKDVTSHFYLDNGQRDSVYDHSRLVKKPGSNLTISSGEQLLVKFDHFTHGQRERGYFTVDSYPVNDASPTGSNIATYEIPIYVSPKTGYTYDLRDSLDFRPKITNTANSVTDVTNISTNPITSTSIDEPSGGLRFPYAGAVFNADLSYYIGRADLITMTKTGKIETTRGVPSLAPKAPTQQNDLMTIAVVDVAPYPSLPDEIARRNNRPDYANSLRTVKNERFTMKDIGVLRDRINRLEYYTSLSLLEKAAQDAQISDSLGNQRFKNGFLVDPFVGHSVGNVYDPDYRISIDPAKREARPPFKLDNIELFYNAANSSNIVRTNVTTSGVSRDQVVTVNGGTFSNGETLTAGAFTGTLRWQLGTKLYVETATGNFAATSAITGGTSGTANTIASVTTTVPGRVMTLPYSHDLVLSQKYATSTRNTAGVFWSFKGNITLSPRDDYWVDTVTQPELQVNFDNNADNWEALVDCWGTQWGDWSVVATGEPVKVGDAERFNGVTQQVGNQLVTNVFQSQEYQQTITSEQLGTQLGFNLNTQVESIGNVVRDVNIQPFMRSRPITFSAVGMKPSSRLYAFFDGIDVRSYITPTDSSYANTANEGGALTSNSDGEVYGIFRIPNNDEIRFRIGDRVFRLTDSVNNSGIIGSVTTSAESTYSSQGLVTTSQEVTIGTTTPEFFQQTVSQLSSATNSWTTTTQVGQIIEDVDDDDGGDDSDPIAQTFLVDTNSLGRIAGTGAYLTKVDLYFATKDEKYPVIIEIREVDSNSGYPTPRVVPHGRKIIASSQVNVSSDGTAPTPVYFNAPIYLQNGRQYGIVVKPGANSPNYSVWIARLGENDIKTGERVSKQPAAGILYASANDLTYTALQDEDMKMNIYLADFSTVSQSGTLVIKNEDKDFMTITNASAAFIKAGEQIHGETYLKGVFANTQDLFISNNSTYVQGATSGATGILTYISTANNEMRVRNVTSGAKFKGGEIVRIRLLGVGGTIVGNSTGAIHSATYPKGTQSYYNNSSINLANSAMAYLHVANVSFANSGPAAGNNRTFLSNRWITGQTDGYVAKIYSLDSLGADLVNIKADYLTPSNSAVTLTTKFATSISARDTSFRRTELNIDQEFAARRYVHSYSAEANTNLTSATMKDGSVEMSFALTSTSRYSSPAFDTNRVSMSIVENLLDTSATIGTSEANTASGGNSRTRYITRRVTLAEGQDAEDLTVYLDAYMPASNGIDVLYKVRHADDSDTFDDAFWIKMEQATANTVVSSSENRGDFRELQFNVPAYPTGSNGRGDSGLYANSSPTNVLYYRNSLGAQYSGFKYFAVKVVMYGSNPGNVPRIKNLRAIALQK